MRLIPRACVIACIVTVSACGGGGGGAAPSTSPSTPAAPAPLTITITSQNGAQSFSPNPANAGGQMVVFRNADSTTHRVVLNDGSLDTGDIAPGATSRALQMPSSGTNYHCTLHTTMVGAISGSSGTPPTCDGPYCDPTGYY
jgi:plastocyanin